MGIVSGFAPNEIPSIYHLFWHIEGMQKLSVECNHEKRLTGSLGTDMERSSWEDIGDNTKMQREGCASVSS